MSRRNIGVAIAVPEPYGSELQGAREQFGDPNASRIVPHVTLLPPTRVAADDLAVIEDHLRKVAMDEQPFEIHLRGTGTFRPVSPVVFVVLTAGIAECERLEARVRSGPLALPRRFPYHPHVTVAHDLPDAALDVAYDTLGDYRARFTVPGLSLFEQDAADVWRPQRDFVFGGAGLPGPVESPAGEGW